MYQQLLRINNPSKQVIAQLIQGKYLYTILVYLIKEDNKYLLIQKDYYSFSTREHNKLLELMELEQ